MTDALDEDRARGRRLSLATEALGEALSACGALPERFRARAEALSAGRSVVPVDDDGGGRFVERLDEGVRQRGRGTRPSGAGDGARSLVAWLGRDLSGWLGDGLDRVPEAAELFGLRPSVTLAVNARLDLLDLHRDEAEAYARWFSEGRDPGWAEHYRVASEMALDEAVDRWCGLGCEGSLTRYVATWQRSGSGWVERSRGGGITVDPGELGRLRALRTTLDELRRRRAPKKKLRAMLAERLGVTVDEVDRLMNTEAAVREGIDSEAAVRRRWALVRPIAEAVADLSRAGEEPTVEAIAARARVHRVLVELAMETLAGDD